MDGMTLLFWLLAIHAVCDYPLQGDFLAAGKNHTKPIPGVPWVHCLLAHAMIHGAGVALATGSIALGVCEFAVHGITDFGKSDGWYGYHADQALHVAAKVAWVWLALA